MASVVRIFWPDPLWDDSSGPAARFRRLAASLVSAAAVVRAAPAASGSVASVASALRDAMSSVPAGGVSVSIVFDRAILGCFTKPGDCATKVLTEGEDVVSRSDVLHVAATPTARPIPACRVNAELVRNGSDASVAEPGVADVDAVWSAAVADDGLDLGSTVVAFV